MTCLSERLIKRLRVLNIPAGYYPPRLALSPLQINSESKVAAMLRRVTVKYRPLHAVRSLNNPRNLAVNRATTRTRVKRWRVDILLVRICSTA